MKSYICIVRPNVAIELFIQYRGMGTALKRQKALRKAKKKAKKENAASNTFNEFLGTVREPAPQMACAKRTLRTSEV
ncbi:hypothetical protein D3C71_2183270 [compost metagenome]